MKLRSAVAAVLLLGGCAEGSTPAAGPDDPAVGTPTDPGSSARPRGQQVEPREDLVEVGPHGWEGAEATGPRAIEVTFYDNVEECRGLARVDVEEAPDRVTITLYTGRVAGVEVCIDLARLKAVTVMLDAPLGDRELIDGAA